ncbi:MAG: type VII toxin-antitoxin system MntA family adenylyltransferase antitoxin [Anaerolineae bacterium]|jgi:predicted nucleotidyltransferase
MAGTRRLESEEDLEALARVFRKYPEVWAVYLFGSAAEGRTHRESDLDLAIVPHSPAARARRLDMLTDLAREGFCNVDLLFLDTDDIVLKYETVRLNQVVYQTEDFDRGEMYSRIVRQYLDFLPYLQIQRTAYKRKVVHASGGGYPQTAEQTG